MTRAEEVTKRIQNEWYCKSNSTGSDLTDLIASLPEFQEQQWIKCSEQMPKPGVMIYVVFNSRGSRQVIPSVYCDDGNKLFSGFARRLSVDEVTHWMLRTDPVLPHEEESDLVKKLRAGKVGPKGSAEFNGGLQYAIEIVKEFEAKGKIY